jgi:Family of unknown function (DUF6114)
MSQLGLSHTTKAVAPMERRSLRAGWRAWRRSRPFWGGILALVAGLLITAIPLSGFRIVFIPGSGITLALLVGTLMIVSAVHMWVTPRIAGYLGGIVIVLALISFVTTDFGGFLIGTLLGIVGGSIAIAWVPGEPVVTAPEAAPVVPGARNPAAGRRRAGPVTRSPRQ